MDLEIKNYSALIAGAGSELGSVCADRLASEVKEVIREDKLSPDLFQAPRSIDIAVAVLPEFEPNELISQSEEDVIKQAWDCIPATVALFQSVLPAMKENGWGRLIVVGPIEAKAITQSMNDLDRVVGLGLLGMQKAISGEFGPNGVTCNSVLCDLSPGDPQIHRKEDLIRNAAAAVSYLASPRADYLTGVTIAVDGGRTKGVF